MFAYALPILITVIALGLVVKSLTKIDFNGLTLAEPKTVSSKTSITTAIRMSLVHYGNGNVREVQYGVAAAGVETSRTKLRKVLRQLREAGIVALTTQVSDKHIIRKYTLAV